MKINKDEVQIRVSSKEEAKKFEEQLIEAGENIANDYWPFAPLLVFGFECWYLSNFEWGLEEITFDKLLKEL